MENKTKKCKHCQSEIDAKAKVCPVCKKKQGSGCLIPIIVVVAVMILIMIIAVSCSPSPATNNDSTTANQTATPQATAENTQPVLSDSGTLGKYSVTIKDYAIAKNYEDKDCIVVTFDFTNNSDTNQSFESAVLAQAFQNGVQIDSTVGIYEDTESYNDVTDSSMSSLQPGATAEVKKAFVLSDMSPVDVEVTEFISLSSDKISKTFMLE